MLSKERTVIATITNMCMVYDGNRILVQDRINPDWPGITFPGGHVEKNESFTDAVVREVLEETGLKISSPKLCGVKDWINEDGSRYIVLLYKTDKFEGTLTPSDEGNVFWVDLSEMKQMHMAEGMETMLEIFLEDHVSEYFLYRENKEWKEVLK